MAAVSLAMPTKLLDSAFALASLHSKCVHVCLCVCVSFFVKLDAGNTMSHNSTEQYSSLD